MPRVKLTEYRAKKLLLGDAYQGVSFSDTAPALLGPSVVKVDQGIKKRFKQGLVALNVTTCEVNAWRQRGFTQFLAESFLPHEASEERYLSLERVRDGWRLLFAQDGGVDIESHPEAIRSWTIHSPDDLSSIVETTRLPLIFLQQLITVFEKNFFALLEINPLVVRGEEVHLLDAAVLVDSCGAFFVNGAWGEADLIRGTSITEAERTVEALQKTTPASLKLTVLHPNGSLFFLLSGGGGSIVIADQAALAGLGGAIGNYGEYSGGPSREETHLYAREVIKLLLASTAPKKALVIAGGVANFTDVAVTFEGLIDALGEQADALRKQGVKVFVRRGGPNEAKGLTRMKEFLEKENLLGSIHGSEAVITQAVDDALRFIQDV